MQVGKRILGAPQSMLVGHEFTSSKTQVITHTAKERNCHLVGHPNIIREVTSYMRLIILVSLNLNKIGKRKSKWMESVLSHPIHIFSVSKLGSQTFLDCTSRILPADLFWARKFGVVVPNFCRAHGGNNSSIPIGMLMPP